MATLTPAQIAKYASDAGFRNGRGQYGQRGLSWAVAVAMAESGGQTDAVSPPNHDTWHSRDHGLWQINDHWHPDEAKSANDPAAAARSAFAISSGGRSFTPWSTFTNGAAAAQLGRATLAVGAMASAVPVVDHGDGGFIPGLPDTGDLLPEGMLPGLPNLPDIAGAVGSIAKAAAAMVSLELKVYAWLANPHNAIRMVEVAAGAVLVVVGIKALAASDDGPVSSVARGAVKVGRIPAKTAKAAASTAATVATGGAAAGAKTAAKAGAAAKIAKGA